MSSHTDDDDISAFVQEIDARKPLGGRAQQGQGQGQGQERNSNEREGPLLPGPSREQGAKKADDQEVGDRRRQAGTVSFPVLTTEPAVDERLRKMHEQFEASLQGFRRRPGKEREKEKERECESDGAQTTFSTRAADPMDVSTRRPGTRVMGGPAQYVRPRFASTGSARSGASIASEEVLGRMDPEFGEDQYGTRRS